MGTAKADGATTPQGQPSSSAAPPASSTQKTEADQYPEGTRLGHYVLGKALGKGTFGKVKIANHTLTGEKVAIKILEKSRIKDKKDIERISREIKILKKVRHPNIIQLYEIIETESELFLIMEYCQNGELFDYIVSHQRLHEKAAVRMYQQLVAGIEYIHKSGICHRDLKPENLLLDFDKTLKIVDFGLSNMYTAGSQEQLKTACGSPCYAAPEMIAGKHYFGLKSDIWSSGVVLYAMVCGFLPFEDPKTSNLYKKILAGEYKIPKFLSSDCAHFISKILNTDPEKRYGIDEIRNHPWFKQQRDKRPQGLFPGREPMPVNDKMYQTMLDEFNYDPDYSVKCIEANRHNQITATYHLLSKKAARQEKNFMDENPTANMIGSLDRSQKPTRLQQQEVYEQKQQMNKTQQQNRKYQCQSTAVNGGRGDRPVTTTIQEQQPMAALNIGDVKKQMQAANPEISAQKKYKLELQAEINKLRSKYQDYQTGQSKGEGQPKKEPAPPKQEKPAALKTLEPENYQKSQKVASSTGAQHQRKSSVISSSSKYAQQAPASHQGSQHGSQPHAHQHQSSHAQASTQQSTKMAPMAITSPIKIQAVHNRPQLQTITHNQPDGNDSIMSYHSRGPSQGGGSSAMNYYKKQPPQSQMAENHEYAKKAMGMTGGFNQAARKGSHAVKSDAQNRMNMTITHGFTQHTNNSIQSGLGSTHHSSNHGPPQYPKNQMIGSYATSGHHVLTTAGQGLRPSKVMTSSTNHQQHQQHQSHQQQMNNTISSSLQQTLQPPHSSSLMTGKPHHQHTNTMYQPQQQNLMNSTLTNPLNNTLSGSANSAWRAIDISMQKGSSNSAQVSAQNRNANPRFSQGNPPPGQYGTIVHPSMVKTNNLVMDSEPTKYQTEQTKLDKSPGINTRNLRNKSIDNTPEAHSQHEQNYIYPSVSTGKRAGSTAAGDRHSTIVVSQSNVPSSKVGMASKQYSQQQHATDYSYNIGPAQYKQSHMGQKNATKFQDLKFHHTTLDFNKSQMSASQNTQGLIASNAMVTTHQKYSSVGPKKTNNSVDLGSKAAAQNITQTVMNSKSSYTQQQPTSQQQKQNLQYSYTQQMNRTKMNAVANSTQPTSGTMNLNISELYKQYAQKSIISNHVDQVNYPIGGQRMAVGNVQNRHRAISVTEAPQPLIESTPQPLGMQNSINSSMGMNHFNTRHASQSSQQQNRKSYKVDFPGVNNQSQGRGVSSSQQASLNNTQVVVNTKFGQSQPIYGRKFK